MPSNVPNTKKTLKHEKNSTSTSAVRETIIDGFEEKLYFRIAQHEYLETGKQIVVQTSIVVHLMHACTYINTYQETNT